MTQAGVDHSTRRRVSPLPLVGVTSLAVGCTSPVPPAPSPRPDLVLITIDTVRADHVGPSGGYGRPTMPIIGSFAASSTVYTQTIAPASWTLPTMVSLATGLGPLDHTVRTVERQLPTSMPTLAEELEAAGYQTAFFGVNPVFLVDRGPTRGFSSVWTDRGAAAGAVNQHVRTWLDTARQHDRPLFLHVHYYEPHCPYRPPQQALDALSSAPVAAGGKATDVENIGCHAIRDDGGETATDLAEYHRRYDAELWSVDAALGRLRRILGERGIDEHDLWVITADHGESFWEHGEVGHSRTLWREELHVPLLVHRPGQAQGTAVPHRVALTDVHQTLRAAGIGGVDPLLQVDGDQDVLSATDAGPRPLLAWHSGRQKLLRTEGLPDVWFDLDADPLEQRPLSAPPPDLVGALDNAVQEATRRAPPPVPLDPSAAELELLRSLGYVF